MIKEEVYKNKVRRQNEEGRSYFLLQTFLILNCFFYFLVVCIHGCAHPPSARSTDAPDDNETRAVQQAVLPKKAETPHAATSPSSGGQSSIAPKKAQREKTIEELTKAVELAPSHAAAYNELGYAYAKKGRYEDAIAQYDKAIELDRNYAWAWYNRGYAWYEQGKYDRAIADFSKAIEYNPRYVDAYNGRGNSWYQKTEYEQAVKEFLAALGLDRGYPLTHYNLGNAYYKKGLYTEAVAEFSKAIELKPGFNQSFSNRGVAFLMLEQYPEAEKDLMTALRMKPDDGMTMVRLAELHSMKKDIVEACKWLKRGVENGYRDFKYVKKTVTLDRIRPWPCYESALEGK